MKQTSPFVITISRQLGSGGSYLGHRLAERLNLMYLDREIVRRAAQQLKVSETHLASRDETATPAWQSVMALLRHADMGLYVPPQLPELTDEEIYQTQSDIIAGIAREFDAVIVGRGGHYVLRKHPRHLSIFLYANTTFRQKRIHEAYKVSMEKAKALIDATDLSRSRYLYSLTRQEWTDARQYHLSIDTGVVGLEAAEEIILAAVRTRFGDLSSSAP